MAWTLRIGEAVPPLPYIFIAWCLMKQELLYFSSSPVKYFKGVNVWSTKPWRHTGGMHWELPSFSASILDGVRWSLHSVTALPREKKPRWSANRTLAGFQRRSGRFGKDKRTFALFKKRTLISRLSFCSPSLHPLSYWGPCNTRQQ